MARACAEPEAVLPDPDAPGGPRAILLVAGLFYGLLTVAGLVWIRLRTGHFLPGSLPGGRPALSMALGGAGAVLIVGLSGLGLRRPGPMRWLAAEFRALLGRCSPAGCFWLALSSAVGEELFFRGAMQPVLGLGLTSVLFGLIHVGPDRRYLLWTSFAFLTGLGLGWLLEWTGSLSGCLLAHFLVNFLNLLQIMRLRTP